MKKTLSSLVATGLLLSSTVVAAAPAATAAQGSRSVVSGPAVKDGDNLFGFPLFAIILAGAAVVAGLVVIVDNNDGQSS